MTENISPADAVEQYIQSRHDALASTQDNHRYRLDHFLVWADEHGVSQMSELDGFDLERYKNWRMSEESPSDCNLVTLEQHLHTLRVFIRWCESADIVTEGLSDKVLIPNVSSSEKSRDKAISHERARNIIDYLSTYHFASTMHLSFHISYHVGCRRSGLHSLDVQDWHSDERFLSFRNRPEEGTRLKLGDEGERNVTVSDDTLAQALDAYIEERRPDVTDEHGREPLLASNQGRLHYQTINKHVYKVTRPCFIGADCPHDRDPDDCEATQYSGYSKCPSSVSSHPIRRSAITHHLSEDVPKEIVSERMSVSTDVLDLHYDARTKEEKRQNRERYLDDI